MSTTKVTKPEEKSKMIASHNTYDHYLAVDWSNDNMAIAHMSATSTKPKIHQQATDLGALKDSIRKLKGRTILTIEETTTSHWLFTELSSRVDKVLVCDPYRNRLLADGPKEDTIDAGKLCTLLRHGLLKEVYHTLDPRYSMRKYISDYEDLVQMGVRLLNQRHALYRSEGFDESEEIPTDAPLTMIYKQLNVRIALYHEHKTAYEELFTRWCKKERLLRHLVKIPGIGEISAVKILGIVLDAQRFANKGHYLGYCGLVTYQKMSGGRSYGKRMPRCRRMLKAVYKTATMAAINGSNPIREYYDHMIHNGVPEHNARNKVARCIASITYGMMKSGQPYDPYRWRKNQPSNDNSK
jgi:transposase